MIWVTWRQHRSEAIAGLALIAALGLIGALLRNPMWAQFHQDALTSCLTPGAGDGCDNAVSDFMNRFGPWANQLAVMLLVVPGMIGVVVGGPLLAREYERGTWRMAWSQTIVRTRWLAVKLGLVCAALIVFGAASTALFTWYRSPMDQLTGRFTYAAFDFEGIVPTAYLLCAFAFAALTGLLIRRTIPAMATAFISWLALRLVVDFWLRPRYQQPVIQTVSPNADIHFGPNVVPPMTGHIGDWILSNTANTISYQPADRFWHFQMIESGLYITLAALAIGATLWTLRRRS